MPASRGNPQGVSSQLFLKRSELQAKTLNREPSHTADSRKRWGQLVPSSFQSYLIRSGDGPSPPLFVRILESAVGNRQMHEQATNAAAATLVRCWHRRCGC